MRTKKIALLQMFRRITQIVFFFGFSGLFALTFSELGQVYRLLVKENMQLVAALPQLLEAITLLCLTIVLGRFFCAWFCAFGAFNDFIYLMASSVFKHKFQVSPKVNNILNKFKFIVLGFIVYVIWTLGSVAFAGASPWDAFAQLPQVSDAITQYTLGSIILGIIVVGSAFIERFFCRYLCPLGAVFVPLSKARIFSISKPRVQCGSCQICTSNCPMGMELNKLDLVVGGECINCLRCISVCPRKNPQAQIFEENLNPLVAGLVAIAAFAGFYSISNFFGNTVAASTSSNSTLKTGTSIAASGKLPKSSTPVNPNSVDTAPDNSRNFTQAPKSNASTGSNFNNGNSSDSSNNSNSSSPENGNSDSSTLYKDGTYTGVGYGHRQGLEVSVTVQKGKITDIEIVSSNETPRYTRTVFNVVPEEIIQAQSTNVDVVSGATQSSEGIIQAVQNALSKAS